MCFTSIKITPLELSSVRLAGAIASQNWSVPFGLLDEDYFYASPQDWATVLSRVFLLDLYKKDTFDCENFALKAMTTVAGYGLNAFGMAVGDCPLGRHGFNVFYSENGWWVFEPQPGFGLGYFPLGENGYRPQIVLI